MKRLCLFGILAVLAACSGSKPKLASGDGNPGLDPGTASRLLRLPLACVDQEEPHFNEGQGASSVKARHPAFYGCFDWPSAVHGHWAMLRLLGSVPDLSRSQDAKESLARHLGPENLRAELAFLEKSPSFGQPFGWAWALRLAAELHLSRVPEAREWSVAFMPLESKVVKLFLRYLQRTKLANRAGLHDNTAYAMMHAWDYARAVGDDHLLKALHKSARAYFAADRDCLLSSEPGPRDLVSPCFAEADLMRRVLGKESFLRWFKRFLPKIAPEQLKPVIPADLQDYQQVNLVGLMFSRAAAQNGLAALLPPDDPRRAVLLSAAEAQVSAAWDPLFDSGYAGSHWLASFAVYYFSAAGL